MPRYESPYDPSTMPKKLEHVIYEKKGHVAYVTINRPEVRNALHSYAYAELRVLLARHRPRSEHLRRHRHRSGRGVLRRPRRQVPGVVPGAGQADPARGSEQSAVPLGRRRPAQRRQSGETADRRHQRLRGRRRAVARAAMPASRHGGHGLERARPSSGAIGLGHDLYARCRAPPRPISRCATAELAADECYRQAIVNKVCRATSCIATCEEMAGDACDSPSLAAAGAGHARSRPARCVASRGRCCAPADRAPSRRGRSHGRRLAGDSPGADREECRASR